MRTETALHHQRLQNIRGMVLLMTVFLLQLLRSSAFETTPGIDKLNRTGKLLPIFSVVRFQNDPCTGNDGKVGTCYTADECSAKGGVRSGVCALGFGQCCVFVAGCGGSSSENCTYFQNNGAQAGECQFEICRCNDNICQLRLDFDSFVISGPSTSTLSVAALFLGEVIDGGGQVSNTGQCLTDSFSVSTPGGANPPTICGINSGQHMYVDASECCNDLTFLLGAEGIDTTLRQRQWSIKITQYSCDYENLAPSGCTQYFFDTDGVETVQTFNFDGGQHLANQNHNFCVRRERGNCKICWTATNDEDFDVSGTSPGQPFITTSVCCGRGSGASTVGYDCLSIPGAKTAMGPSTNIGPSRICGRNKGLATTFGGDRVTICSQTTPFSIRFLSDEYEVFGDTSESGVRNKGFKLTYIQSSEGC